VHIDPADRSKVSVSLSNTVPPTAAPIDTEWVKHVKIQSELLSKIWGRPIYLGATVLLPRDYASRPDIQYPVIYQQQAHFNSQAPFEFRTDKPVEQEEDRLARERRGYETGYDFYQAWRSNEFPRVIAVTLQHPTPYADLSAAINSANNGPYGDAIATELSPYIEKHFRTIAQPYARMIVGKSAGGRDALAQQLRYPSFYGGAWIFHPWPFDYQRYFAVNIYEDENAFSLASSEIPNWFRGSWSPLERNFIRTLEGQPVASMRQVTQHDAIMASQAGGEFGADDAINGPTGDDGYPSRSGIARPDRSIGKWRTIGAIIATWLTTQREPGLGSAHN
jgi:predicted alpha/beta superfamily hydrolase